MSASNDGILKSENGKPVYVCPTCGTAVPLKEAIHKAYVIGNPFYTPKELAEGGELQVGFVCACAKCGMPFTVEMEGLIDYACVRTHKLVSGTAVFLMDDIRLEPRKRDDDEDD